MGDLNSGKMLSSDKISLLIEKNIPHSLYLLNKGKPKAMHCNQAM